MKQKIVFDPGVRRGLLNCSRLRGKSVASAVKAVHWADSMPGALVVDSWWC